MINVKIKITNDSNKIEVKEFIKMLLFLISLIVFPLSAFLLIALNLFSDPNINSFIGVVLILGLIYNYIFYIKWEYVKE